ncbi:MAG TPA: NDP-sugar synthase [Solirubrobacteraceae bacterium]
MALQGLLVVEDVDTRAYATGSAAPVALAHVANRPIAHHAIDALREAGVEELVIACPSEHAREIGESLQHCGFHSPSRLHYVMQPAPLCLGDALRLAVPIIDGEPCIVHLANGLVDGSLSPLVGRLSDTPDVVLTVQQSPLAGDRLSLATQRVLHLELDPARGTGLGVGGAWLFGPGALRPAQGAGWHAGMKLDLTSVRERVRAAGGRVEVQLVSAWRSFAGDAPDLLEVNRIALDRLETDARRPRSDGNRIEGRVQVNRSALVRSSVIIGPSVIGPDARIVDAYIGPYTAIGAGACIEGAEIERSIIAAGASVMHLGGRMEGSVVGRNSRIFRDFSLPRALRIRGGDGTEVAFF